MTVTATRASREALRTLPTTARPRVDAGDVAVPDGYAVEAVMAGLSFPCAMCVADDGTVFVAEGGSTWPTRPYMPPRILRMTPDGAVDHVYTELLGGPRGLSYRDNKLYVSIKGGYHARVLEYDLATDKRRILVDNIPSGGWHEPGGPLFGPHDGRMYFMSGSVSLQGAIEPEGFTVDIAKHPDAHDVPGQDVTLTGNNVWSRNPTTPFPYYAETGAYQKYGTPARKGQVVKGEKLCTTGVWRANPDGSDVELIAWGIRNPFGPAFTEAGELYVADNCFEEKGERAIGQDPDRIWHVKNAKAPHGSVKTPDWYGFPEIAGDGKPVWDDAHIPNRGQRAKPLLENPPPWAGPAAWVGKPHTGHGKMAFCHHDEFGHRGDLFLCRFGTYAPLNSIRPEQLAYGFDVLRIDLGTGESEPFVRNRRPGPSSAKPVSGGIERPVDCAFTPDGRSLYVLDFGLNTPTTMHVVAYARTGVLWKITKL